MNITDQTESVSVETVSEYFYDFLNHFKVSEDAPSYLYRDQVLDLPVTNKRHLIVDYTHFRNYSRESAEGRAVEQAIKYDYLIYSEGLDAAVQRLCQLLITSYMHTNPDIRITLSLFDSLPPHVHALRSLTAAQAGMLCAVSASVTRANAVRPIIDAADYQCEQCNSRVHVTSVNGTFKPPPFCRNCLASRWVLRNETCVFSDAQRLIIQENARDIPPGDTPLTRPAVCLGAAVDAAKPGERVRIFGLMVVNTRDVSEARSRATSTVVDLPPLHAHYAARPPTALSLSFGFIVLHIMSEEAANEPDVSAMAMSEHAAEPGAVAAVDAEALFPEYADSLYQIQDTINEGEHVLAEHAQELGLHYASQPLMRYLSSLNAQEADAFVAMQRQAVASVEYMRQLTVGDPTADTYRNLRLPSDWYNMLARSFASHVFGHEDVKRGILLLLLGGTTKISASDDMRLRGDINVCLVGDPSCAKSQFLKYVTSSEPRAVYTSGKASTAAGLTAAVVRDSETGEFTVEAGALVLADNGICAIDEFEKLNVQDQVAIHEAMEQQTVSVSKAGINTTLNARASVLAAMNPVSGRYDTRRSLVQNVGLTPAIMSRFDMIFVIQDHPDADTDRLIAQKIISNHTNGAQALQPEVPAESLFLFLRAAQHISPLITPEAAAALEDEYFQMRQTMAGGNDVGVRMTTRQLESLIRMSEALAKLHASNQVDPIFVREAARLLRGSLVRTRAPDVDIQVDQTLLRQVGAGMPAFDQELFPVDPAAALAPPPEESTIVTFERDEFERFAGSVCRAVRQRREATIQQIMDDVMAMEHLENTILTQEKIAAIITKLKHNEVILSDAQGEHFYLAEYAPIDDEYYMV